MKTYFLERLVLVERHVVTKFILSHITGLNSARIEVDSDGDIVAVEWWESNQTK